MKKYFLLMLMSGFCFSCGISYTPEIERALQQAGRNRRELGKVLKHYRRTPSDSLKYKAAEFLIANMPGKYSEYRDAPWNDVATVYLRWTSAADRQRVLETYKVGDPVRREDVKCIAADYLIANIELAFEAWHGKPWGKYVSFETFCEEILPYRVSTEPLENWREKVLASFDDINRELKEDATMTAVGACAKVNKRLPQFRLDRDFPPMCYSQLMASTRGVCDGETALAAFVMRALGIPVTVDFSPLWADDPIGHGWNSVCDSAGNHISFMGTETNPYEPHLGTTKLKSKAYRRTFARNRIITNTPGKDIPPIFHGNMVDISAEHEECVDVTVPIVYHPDVPTKYAYLALLHSFRWSIAAYGYTDGVSITFPAVGKNIIYLPVYYVDGSRRPAGDPFLLDSAGNPVTYSANAPNMLLTFSLAPNSDKFYFPRMVDGVFEGASKPDFSDAEVIHTVKKTPELHNSVTLPGARAYRYVRYKSPEYGSCNVSEIELLGAHGQKLAGAHIGTEGSFGNLGQTGDKAFDGDMATFYDAAESSGAWTGLDLGKQQRIAEIRFVPRTAGSAIYAGHEYELFCWDKDSWKSLGKQVAQGAAVKFLAPPKALFYIVNLTAQDKNKNLHMADNQKSFTIAPSHADAEQPEEEAL